MNNMHNSNKKYNVLRRGPIRAAGYCKKISAGR